MLLKPFNDTQIVADIHDYLNIGFIINKVGPDTIKIYININAEKDLRDIY